MSHDSALNWISLISNLAFSIELKHRDGTRNKLRCMYDCFNLYIQIIELFLDLSFSNSKWNLNKNMTNTALHVNCNRF